jgi:hypothetical protein
MFHILECITKKDPNGRSIAVTAQVQSTVSYLCKPRSSGSSVDVLMTLTGLPLALRQI